MTSEKRNALPRRNALRIRLAMAEGAALAAIAQTQAGAAFAAYARQVGVAEDERRALGAEGLDARRQRLLASLLVLRGAMLDAGEDARIVQAVSSEIARLAAMLKAGRTARPQDARQQARERVRRWRAARKAGASGRVA